MRKKIIPLYRQKLGGKVITVKNVVAEMYYDRETGKWHECFAGPEWRRIERAIEKALPGWFHVCYPDRTGKRKVEMADCPACQRVAKEKFDKTNVCDKLKV